ncbi:MAG: hypothetical protein HY901_03620, partial [Deltaproteobacteria bacterium]|nr:hypothetical protein [Deltaproteobacteria bacterium]
MSAHGSPYTLEEGPAGKAPFPWLRRLLFWYVAGAMGGAQGMFLLTELVGVDITPQLALWAGVIAFPLALAAAMLALECGRQAALEPAAWDRWALIGLAMFVVWAGVYLLVCRVPLMQDLRYLPATLEARIPLRPAFSLLYILLYPIYLLPYFVVRERPVFQRLVAADLVMIVTCSLIFVAVPVAVERPPLPSGTDLGTWVLGVVWSNDVRWNCMPSEHCMAAMIASLACWESNRRAGAFAFLST